MLKELNAVHLVLVLGNKADDLNILLLAPDIKKATTLLISCCDVSVATLCSQLLGFHPEDSLATIIRYTDASSESQIQKQQAFHVHGITFAKTGVNTHMSSIGESHSLQPVSKKVSRLISVHYGKLTVWHVSHIWLKQLEVARVWLNISLSVPHSRLWCFPLV